MIRQRFSRRQFLKSAGVGSAAALLANAGLPLVLAQDRSLSQASQSNRLQVTPDVELLVGDVIGFGLQSRE